MSRTLAIIHYHLNRGGVTRVIRNHLLALRATRCPFDRVVIVHGGRADDWPEFAAAEFAAMNVTQAVVPLLDYDEFHPSSSPIGVDIDRLATALSRAVSGVGGSADDTVLHFHNHALGKNRALPGAMVRLALAGFRCLLQIHDFAEDLRPSAYQYLASELSVSSSRSLPSQLYPQALQIHYAVLNGRDFGILSTAGADSSRLHYLPNPVDESPSPPDRSLSRRRLDRDLPVDRPVFLYPVRGIRRKNVGEFLLWAAMFGDTSTFVLSLAPTNPLERGVYDQFVRLASELQLPVHFDTGKTGGLTLAENVAACDTILTTSIAEGFGMVFLESWLAGRPLVGRDLPEITRDMTEAGLDLSRLASSLRIPIQWLGRETVLAPLRQAYETLVQSYGLPSVSAEDLDRRLEPLIGETAVDFARLPPKLQARVVQQVAQDRGRSLAALADLNPTLASAGVADKRQDRDMVASNADVVRRSFGLHAIGKRLGQLYSTVQAARVESSVSRLPAEESVLATFVDIERLYPVRFA